MRHAFGSRPYHHHQRRRLEPRTSGASHQTMLRWAREATIIAIAVLVYFLSRGLVAGRESLAVDNAHRLISLEKALSIFEEQQLQTWALGWEPLTRIVNTVYIWGHWPVIALTLTWLVIAHRDRYPVYRNAILISGAVGLVIFVLYPMAPPRFILESSFVDTVTLHSDAYRVLQPPSLVNQYAAMPSLHCGWDLLMGIALFRYGPRGRRWAAVLLPIAMYIAVVLTANHFFLDGLIGGAIVIAALALAERLHRWSAIVEADEPVAQAVNVGDSA